MANVTITQLPAAGPITGTESVPIVQNGQTVQTTTGAISASPSQNQTFLTLNNEPSLPNSRYLSTGTGLGLTDGGAQSDLEIILNGASGSLEAAGNGVIVKTGSTTVAARTISTSGAGLTVSNGNGVSGNPTIALDGLPASLANMSGTGILGVVGGSSITSMVITGTNNQITVANGAGPGNPTISITTDPIIPGTGAMTIPKGTTAQRPGGVNGMIRFNTDTDGFEIYDSGGWSVLPAGAITLINTGTGLTGGPITTSGTISIANTGVAAGIYGDQSTAIEISINAQGQITSAIAMPIVISASQIIGGFFDTTQGGTGRGTYVAGDTLYYASGTSLSTLAISPSDYIMTSSGTAPQWSDPATITVGTATTATSATNIAGGAGGQLVYNTNASTTSFIPLGTVGYLLQAGLTEPIYVDPATVTVGTATTATNVAGGAANQIVYNTASSTTSFISAPSAPGEYLGWNGSAFVWSSVSATSATNLSGGTAGALPYQTGVGATGFLNLGTTTFLLRAGASAPEYVDPSSVTVGSATNATNASNATNITVTDNTLSASTYYPVVSLNTTGSNAPTTSSTKLSFVPSTGVLSATGFSGALNGTVGATTPNAGTFTTLKSSDQTDLGGDSSVPGLRVLGLAGATRYLQVEPSVSGNVTLRAGDTGNPGFVYVTRGTGNHSFTTNNTGSNEQFRVAHTASAVNYVQVTGAATGGAPIISAQGSDSSVSLNLAGKGASGFVQFTVNSILRGRFGASGVVDLGISSSGGTGFQISSTTNQVNYLQAAGAIASAGPVLSAQGSDTNIDLALTPKGTGRVTTAAEIVATGGISGGTF